MNYAEEYQKLELEKMRKKNKLLSVEIEIQQIERDRLRKETKT